MIKHSISLLTLIGLCCSSTGSIASVSEANPYNFNTSFSPQTLKTEAVSQAAAGDGGDTAAFRPINVPLLENSKVNFELTAESTELLGDAIDLNSGSVSFAATDVSIPGNFAINVALSRRHHDVNTTYRNTAEFGDWGLDLPSIQTRLVKTSAGFWGSGKECSANYQQEPPAVYYSGKVLLAPAYWGGVNLSLGSSQEKLLTNIDNTLSQEGVAYYTASNIKISCYTRADGRGEGFKAVSPDGTSYYFDVPHQVRAFMPSYPQLPVYNYFMRISKIVDRFGNNVVFSYTSKTASSGMTSNNLTSIQSSDGRSINLFYEHPTQPYLVTKVQANSKSWSYQYINDNKPVLTKVVQPDGRSWGYTFTDVDSSRLFDTYVPNMSMGDCAISKGDIVRSSLQVTHPNGVKGIFEFESRMQGTTNMPLRGTYGDGEFSYEKPRCSVTMALVKKRLIGPSIDHTWNYAYSENEGSYNQDQQAAKSPSGIEPSSEIASSYNLTDLKTTTVTSPDTSKTQHVFYRRYDYLEGTEIATRYYDITNGGRNGALLRTVLHKFNPSAYRLGVSLQPEVNSESQEFRHDKSIEKTIEHTVDGTDTYVKQYSAYNVYGTAEVVEESNSLSQTIRKTVTSYLNDRSRWVLQLLLNRTITQGADSYNELSHTYYSDTSTELDKLYLLKTKSVFGKLRESYDYYTNSGKKGLLKQIGYPRLTSSMWAKFDNYKRGKAQITTVPDRYSATLTSSISINVNDSGVVTSVTDFNGNTTVYARDAMERVTAVDLPGTYWLGTNITYDFTAPNYAVVQRITKGNSRKINYYDGLLQIVKTEEGLLSGDSFLTSSIRVQNNVYNSYGKVVFSSRPSSNSNETFGTSTLYDGLQRVLSQTNTANGDVSYSYLSNNTVNVQNGRGAVTSTKYLAFGSPANDLALSVAQAENAQTTLQYNIANLPTRIEQGGYAETREYNQNMELCLQKRPETGVKVYSYNDLGQVKTYAEGLNGNGSSCTDYTPDTTAVVTLDYDNLGDVKAEKFADGTPAKTTVLDAQGNLKQLNSGAVTWDYTYNSANLVESETLSLDQKSFPLGYTYNAMGHMTQRRYPAGLSINYGVNALGEIESVSQDSTMLASNVKYHPDGQIAEFVYGNGLKFKQTLDGKMRPFERQVFTAFTPAVSHSYQYDAVNNIEVINDAIEPVKSLTMTYDGLDRIKTSSSGNFGSIAFNYDTLGNIVQKQIFTTVHNYSYDNVTKRLSSAQGMTFSYDTRGNVLNNGRRDFVYNRSNQLVSSGALQYVYDGHGRRVKQLKNSQNTYSVYDMQGSLVYRGNPDTTATASVYLGAQLIAELDSGGPAPLPAKPTITLNLTSTLVVGSCNIFGQKCTNSRNVIYGWSSSNASSCQGLLNQTTTTGSLMSSLALSGTSLPSTLKSYPATDALYTLTLTCTGPGGSTTQTKSVAGVGSTVPGEEM